MNNTSIIEDAQFKTYGCSSVITSSSLVINEYKVRHWMK
ncbi:MAG: iron-sulfur cluster assembly scaffold protein [Arsenophonus sp. NC-CH8-MAG3]